MKHLMICTFLCLSFTSKAQKLALYDIKTDLASPVQNLKLFSDSLSSSFYIIIKSEVKLHKHLLHSEHVYVVEGEADMRLGDQSFHIAPGNLIFIPKGEAHSVKVTRGPLKVLSIQSPQFDGTDRVMME